MLLQVERSIELAESGAASSLGASAATAGTSPRPTQPRSSPCGRPCAAIVRQIVAGATGGKLDRAALVELQAAAAHGHHVRFVDGGEAGHSLTINPAAPPADATTNIPPPPPW